MLGYAKEESRPRMTLMTKTEPNFILVFYLLCSDSVIK